MPELPTKAMDCPIVIRLPGLTLTLPFCRCASSTWLLGEAVERRGKLAVTERLDEIGDVQAQKPDEEGVLFRGFNWLAFVDRIAG